MSSPCTCTCACAFTAQRLNFTKRRAASLLSFGGCGICSQLLQPVHRGRSFSVVLVFFFTLLDIIITFLLLAIFKYWNPHLVLVFISSYLIVLKANCAQYLEKRLIRKPKSNHLQLTHAHVYPRKATFIKNNQIIGRFRLTENPSMNPAFPKGCLEFGSELKLCSREAWGNEVPASQLSF